MTQKLSEIIEFLKDLGFSFLIFIPLYLQWLLRLLTHRERKSVKGKLALITGGALGLGREIATKLAKLGCNIAIADVNKHAADEAAQELSTLGVIAKSYRVDVAKAEDIIQLRNDVERDFGNVDILINNAGIVSVTNLEEGPDHLTSLVNVNLLGVILMTKYFLEKMESQGSGHIVCISSMAGLHATPHFMTYTATKFGVNGFMQALTEYLRMENLSNRIKTTCIFPYFIRTKKVLEDFLNPNIRIKALSVEEAAESAVTGILQERTTVTIPGSLELLVKIVNLLPLSIQQQIYRDRLMNEKNLRNPNF